MKKYKFKDTKYSVVVKIICDHADGLVDVENVDYPGLVYRNVEMENLVEWNEKH